MAILEIVTTAGQALEHSFARGNVGVLTDAQGGKLNEFQMPEGAGASSVFPSENNVDQGVSYGPNGADFTGNLEQPVEGDVKAGVQYGAGGVEFEGSLIAGSEHSHTFVS